MANLGETPVGGGGRVRQNWKVPVVSVVIPAYNRADTIGRAVGSVLRQSYQDFEVIVVDDFSCDKTSDVIHSLNDGRIRYIRHEENKGAPAARNTGIRVARGKYIAFQDSDDEWLPEKLEKQVKVFEKAPAEVGVVYTAFWRVENSEREYIPYSWVNKKEGDIHRELLRGSFITTPSIAVRKSCFEKAGVFDEQLPRLQDWELVLRLSKFYEFRFVDEPLVISTFRADSITADKDARIRALKRILSKYLDDFKEDTQSLSRFYYAIGVYQCLRGEIEEGDRYLSMAFEVNPDSRVLAENYFTVGRGLCSISSEGKGRRYLVQAVKTYPYNLKVILTFLLSLLGNSVYRSAVKLYRAFKMR